MTEEMTAFLKRVRKTLRRSNCLIETAQLRLDETNRLLQKSGLSFDGGVKDSFRESVARISYSQAEDLGHRHRQLRRFMKTIRL